MGFGKAGHVLATLALLATPALAHGDARADASAIMKGIGEAAKTLMPSRAAEYDVAEQAEYDVPEWEIVEGNERLQWGAQHQNSFSEGHPDGTLIGLDNGRIEVAGQSLRVAVTGARSFYSRVYFGGIPEATTSADVVAGFQAAGYEVVPLLCAIDGSDAGKWYHIETPGKSPAHLLFGPILMAGPGNGVMIEFGGYHFEVQAEDHPERYGDCGT